MNYAGECDCGDYCAWCHPEMCGLDPVSPYIEQLTLAREVLKDIAREVARVGSQL